MNKNQIDNLTFLNRQLERKLNEDHYRRKMAKQNININKISEIITAHKHEERGN